MPINFKPAPIPVKLSKEEKKAISLQKRKETISRRVVRYVPTRDVTVYGAKLFEPIMKKSMEITIRFYEYTVDKIRLTKDGRFAIKYLMEKVGEEWKERFILFFFSKEVKFDAYISEESLNLIDRGLEKWSYDNLKDVEEHIVKLVRELYKDKKPLEFSRTLETLLEEFEEVPEDQLEFDLEEDEKEKEEEEIDRLEKEFKDIGIPVDALIKEKIEELRFDEVKKEVAERKPLLTFRKVD